MIIDFPECLFFAEVFLRGNFDDIKCLYVTNGAILEPTRILEYSIVLLSGVTQNQPLRDGGRSKPATVSGIDLRVARRMPHNGVDEPTQSASNRTDYSAESSGQVRSADSQGVAY